ncbi:bifunctional GDP-fucose synthetase: GDP-4-dehydro-6-deoxy-D-mannose epimerase and GDP-4-dehydro-6-L-deoxygalactose reductase [Desulfosarcina cetonica]|uniref:GDP-L-fucose synthase family protein n=1 Tax=Desulfosarcina cetonica TaxID=90730 RepID=UPI0006D12E47|nr:GDP-L-fucose synthase [Desulfosarcina cetonica]VTR65020.1 bifunctional GDP-fucose synthetase: GDP-4-dehydro-6-deoxy-D-mannose epimerase and GDP-4-dehydro-6-L-deoxygalactose reductase [Desulfosarcina cetonica]
MKKESKIFVAGHRGLVGSAITEALERRGYNNLIQKTHAHLDLEDQRAVADFFASEKPDFVFLAAAKVGGILANNTYPADFIYRNLAIQNHVIQSAWKHGVKRLIFLGSSCIYPRDCPQPIKESYLLNGPLEPTNRSYAVAKIAGIEMCWAYNRQYGTQFMPVMPTNLYGPGDNYDLQTSHVLPAIIRKCHLAKLAQQGDVTGIKADEISVGPIPAEVKAALGVNPAISQMDVAVSPAPIFWGTGSVRREFLYSADMADACIHIMSLPERIFRQFLNEAEPPLINIGCGTDQTIAECVDLVRDVVGYDGDVIWDRDKPDGTPQKLLNTKKLTELGWQPRINLKEGLKSAYLDYLDRIAI